LVILKIRLYNREYKDSKGKEIKDMEEPQAKVSLSLFDKALPISFVLPCSLRGKRVPMVWIDAPARAEVTQAQERMTVLGRLASSLNQNERREAYGKAYTFWIYAVDLYPDTFFLHVTLIIPTFTFGEHSLPLFQAEYLLRCDLEQEATGLLLSTIDESLECFLQFGAAPLLWLRELVTPVSMDTGEQLGPRLAHLIHSSLPVSFNADSFAIIKQQFDAWQRKRETTTGNR
jgi:hypothetical protein